MKNPEIKFELDDNYLTILYVSFQESIRELSVSNKEKGYLMLKIFRKYMEESEKKWFQVIENIVKYSLLLKHQVEFLLSQYFTKPEDTQRIMGNSDLTAENLAEHKRLLEIALGAYYSEEGRRKATEKKIKSLEEEINKWILDWDQIRKCEVLRARVFLTKESDAKIMALYKLIICFLIKINL